VSAIEPDRTGYRKTNDKVTISAIEACRQYHACGYYALWERVVVLRDPKEQTYGQGLIVIPDNAQAAKRYGTIVALGDGLPKRVRDVLRLGQRCAFTRYDALELDLKLVETTVSFEFFHWKDVYVVGPADAALEDEWAAMNANILPRIPEGEYDEAGEASGAIPGASEGGPQGVLVGNGT